MLTIDSVVQSAFVVILAWLIGLGAAAAGIPLSQEVLYALAGAIITALLSKFGVAAVAYMLRNTRAAKLFER